MLKLSSKYFLQPNPQIFISISTKKTTVKNKLAMLLKETSQFGGL